MNYIPSGTPRAALLALGEHGAQYGSRVASRLGIETRQVNRAFEACVRHELVDREVRIHEGHKQVFWFLTPAGAKVASQLSSEVAA